MNDPLHCGSVGHSCRGSTCVQGLCSPDEVATIVSAAGMVVHDDELVIIAYANDTKQFRLFRGGKTKGSMFTQVPGPAVQDANGDGTHEVAVGGDFLYFARWGQWNDLYRRPLVGTSATSDEKIGAPSTTKVQSFAVDDVHLAFTTDTTPTSTWWRTHDGAPSEFPSEAVSPARGMTDLSIATGSVFGHQYDEVYEVPFGATTSSLVAELDTLKHVSSFIATGNTFYGVAFSYTSSSVSCQTTDVEVWRHRRTGGATTKAIASGNVWPVPRPRADDKGVVFGWRPCNTGSGGTKIMASRAGDGAVYQVAWTDAANPVFAIDDEWVYFVRFVSSPDTPHMAILRVAR